LDLVILLAEHDEPTLAAKKKRQLAPLKLATSTPKNRVWGFENIPSGRPNIEAGSSWENATGSVQYTYRNASGRAEWLSRDPIAERGGINLYDYVGNDPIDGTDPLGLKTCWKHVLMTTFGDSKGDDKGYMGDNLKPGDLAVGNGAANSSNRYPSKSASNGPGGLTIPYNTPVFVDPNHSSPYNGTVKDYGAYDIDHPSTGKGDWVDRWNPNASRHNQSDHGWISIDVDDCKSCPSGWSEAPRAQPVH
jgi:RHS repeat-associated protein